MGGARLDPPPTGGASGPAVIEGFHGVRYDKPVQRTREAIEICRAVWARQEPLVHSGPTYQIPLTEAQGGTAGLTAEVETP